MRIVVFHGSPRKGNTHKATQIFMDELLQCGDVRFTEFFFPSSLPKFCTGCQICLGAPNEKCPHAEFVTPILNEILKADALVFTTPHHGACDMSSCIKNLLDHLDFLTLNVAPRKELFTKKAFIITTGAGSTAAIRPIRKYLINWGMNSVHVLGLRMLTDKWDKMPSSKQERFERKLRNAARHFYRVQKKKPYLSAVFMYYMSKFILKKYAGEDTYPYKHWEEEGYFKKRPF